MFTWSKLYYIIKLRKDTGVISMTEPLFTKEEWEAEQKRDLEEYFAEKEKSLNELKEELTGTALLKYFGEMIRNEANSTTAKEALSKWYGINDISEICYKLTGRKSSITFKEIAKLIKPTLFKLAEHGFIETELKKFKVKTRYGRYTNYAKITHNNTKRVWKITNKGIEQLRKWVWK